MAKDSDLVEPQQKKHPKMMIGSQNKINPYDNPTIVIQDAGHTPKGPTLPLLSKSGEDTYNTLTLGALSL